MKRTLGHEALSRDPRSSRALSRLAGVGRTAVDALRAGTSQPSHRVRTALDAAGIVSPASLWDREARPAGVDGLLQDAQRVASDPTSTVGQLRDVLGALTSARRTSGLSPDGLSRLATVEARLVVAVEAAQHRAATAAATAGDDALERLRFDLEVAGRALRGAFTLAALFGGFGTIRAVLDGRLDQRVVDGERQHAQRWSPSEESTRLVVDAHVRSLERLRADVDVSERLRIAIDEADGDVDALAAELAELLIRARETRGRDPRMTRAEGRAAKGT